MIRCCKQFGQAKQPNYIINTLRNRTRKPDAVNMGTCRNLRSQITNLIRQDIVSYFYAYHCFLFPITMDVKQQGIEQEINKIFLCGLMFSLCRSLLDLIPCLCAFYPILCLGFYPILYFGTASPIDKAFLQGLHQHVRLYIALGLNITLGS